MENDIYSIQKFIDTDLNKEMNRVFCTDYVYLSGNTEKSLAEIWKTGAKNVEKDGKHGYLCPADLLIQGTVPLKNLTFVNQTNDTDSEYRIHIFENYYEFLPILFDHDKTVVGLIEIKFKAHNTRYFIGVSILRDYPNLLTPAYMGCYGNIKITQATKNDEEALQNILNLANNVLGLWYAVQLCLLNPVTEVLFSKPTMQKLRGKERIAAQERNKSVKYIKRYYIKEDDVDRVLYGGDKSFNRKCLVWYVTGHWREYKTGKRTFVNGYFKGALRNTPNKEVARKRDLVIPEMEVLNGI